MGKGFILGVMKYLKLNSDNGCMTCEYILTCEYMVAWLGNILKTIELYVLNGWTLCDINYISIKLLKIRWNKNFKVIIKKLDGMEK